MVRPLSLRPFALFAALTTSLAHAWSVPIDAATPADVAVTRTSFDTNGRLWAEGTAGAARVLLRYDAGPAPVVRAASARDVDVRAMLALDDGGVVLGGGDLATSDCRIVRYDAGGAQRWSATLPNTCVRGQPADLRLWPAGPDGSLWVAAETQAVLLGADGQRLRAVANGERGRAEAVDPRDGTLYFAGADIAAGGVPMVVALDRVGGERWRWRGTAPNASRMVVTVTGDATLRIAGVGAGGVFAASIGTGGVQQWATVVEPNIAASAVRRLQAPFVDAAGVWLALDADGASGAIRLGADGQVRARVPRDATGANGIIDALAAPDGEIMLARGPRIVRVDASGAIRHAWTAPDATTRWRAVAFDAQRNAIALRTDKGGTFVRLDPAGNDLAAPVTAGVAADVTAANRALLPDGDIVAWTRSANGARELLRVSADGAVRWRVATPGNWSATARVDDTAGALAADAGRVCTLDALRRAGMRDMTLDCYATGDGRALWTRTLRAGDTAGGPAVGRLHLAADGSVTAWYETRGTAGDEVRFARVDRDGAVRAEKTYTNTHLIYAKPLDAAFALLASGDAAIVAGADGNERYRPALTVAGEDRAAAAFLPDGGLVAITQRTSPPTEHALVRYAANGTVAWRRALAQSTHPRQPLAVAGDAVYVATCCTLTPSGANVVHAVARYALADGAPAWSGDYVLGDAAHAEPSQLAATPAGDAIVAVNGWSRRTVDLHAFDPADGRIRARHRAACRSENCLVAEPLATASRLHVLDGGIGGDSSLLAWPIPPADATGVRIEQLGLTGAWWAAYSNGEGFVLDYLPGSRTLFMPWFTYSREGGNDTGGQRWYAVQGNVPQNARSVTLPIAVATGGVFDAGPIVAARVVGSAKLDFSDCDNGTLQYAFDAPNNDGAAGTITLSRLSPALEPCILADGTVVPGAGARPFANGFDARMSGSWFEPETSGQGIEFVLQPGGYFFGTWFTYDRAGQADDPGAQRWYTLQGSLAQARNGVVDIPIVQGIGGAFDRTPTRNATIVGTARLAVTACDRGTLTYRFDKSEGAGAMYGLTGSIDLVKIGGCATTP